MHWLFRAVGVSRAAMTHRITYVRGWVRLLCSNAPYGMWVWMRRRDGERHRFRERRNGSGMPHHDFWVVPNDSRMPPNDSRERRNGSGMPHHDFWVVPNDSRMPPNDSREWCKGSRVPRNDFGVPHGDFGLRCNGLRQRRNDARPDPTEIAIQHGH
jgi:hypothetical protein